MKKGRKTAVRVFKSKEEADEYIAASKEQLYIEQQKEKLLVVQETIVE